MTFERDPNLIKKMRERLAYHFDCEVCDVSEVKAELIKMWQETYQDDDGEEIRSDIAEYHVVMDIADLRNDDELAYWMHLYSVGYFEEDTKMYIPQQGEEYEIVNRNYFNAICTLSISKLAS